MRLIAELLAVVLMGLIIALALPALALIAAYKIAVNLIEDDADGE